MLQDELQYQHGVHDLQPCLRVPNASPLTEQTQNRQNRTYAGHKEYQ